MEIITALVWGMILQYARRDQEKPWKTSIRITGLRTELRTSWTQWMVCSLYWLAPVTETTVQSNQLNNDHFFSRLGGQFRSAHVSHPNIETVWWWRYGARSWVHWQNGYPATTSGICTKWLLHHRVHSCGTCCRCNLELYFVLYTHLKILWCYVTPVE